MLETNRLSLYGFEMREPDLRRSDERKTYDIKALWQRNHEILALAVRGLKQTEIAEILDITPQTVSNTLNSDLGRHKLSVMRRTRDEAAVEVSNRISYLAEKALDVYEKIFEDENDMIPFELQKKTADTVMLELSGHRVPTKIQAHSVHTVASIEEIEQLKERGKAAMREAGMIVELPEEDDGEGSHHRPLESPEKGGNGNGDGLD